MTSGQKFWIIIGLFASVVAIVFANDHTPLIYLQVVTK